MGEMKQGVLSGKNLVQFALENLPPEVLLQIQQEVVYKNLVVMAMEMEQGLKQHYQAAFVEGRLDLDALGLQDATYAQPGQLPGSGTDRPLGPLIEAIKRRQASPSVSP